VGPDVSTTCRPSASIVLAHEERDGTHYNGERAPPDWPPFRVPFSHGAPSHLDRKRPATPGPARARPGCSLKWASAADPPREGRHGYELGRGKPRRVSGIARREHIEQDVPGRDIFIIQPACPPVSENLEDTSGGAVWVVESGKTGPAGTLLPTGWPTLFIGPVIPRTVGHFRAGPEKSSTRGKTKPSSGEHPGGSDPSPLSTAQWPGSGFAGRFETRGRSEGLKRLCVSCRGLRVFCCVRCPRNKSAWGCRCALGDCAARAIAREGEEGGAGVFGTFSLR